MAELQPVLLVSTIHDLQTLRDDSFGTKRDTKSGTNAMVLEC